MKSEDLEYQGELLKYILLDVDDKIDMRVPEMFKKSDYSLENPHKKCYNLPNNDLAGEGNQYEKE